MRLCKVSDLVGTEILAKDAMTLEYKILLSAGTLLKPEYIEKLKELNVREVYIREGAGYKGSGYSQGGSRRKF